MDDHTSSVVNCTVFRLCRKITGSEKWYPHRVSTPYSADNFLLPLLAPYIAALRAELVAGRGLALMRGLPGGAVQLLNAVDPWLESAWFQP